MIILAKENVFLKLFRGATNNDVTYEVCAPQCNQQKLIRRKWRPRKFGCNTDTRR